MLHKLNFVFSPFSLGYISIPIVVYSTETFFCATLELGFLFSRNHQNLFPSVTPDARARARVARKFFIVCTLTYIRYYTTSVIMFPASEKCGGQPRKAP